MVHVEKNNNLKRHAFRSPRRLKTMATGTHGAEAPSDSEAPPQLEDTVSLCDHPLHPLSSHMARHWSPQRGTDPAPSSDFFPIPVSLAYLPSAGTWRYFIASKYFKSHFSLHGMKFTLQSPRGCFSSRPPWCHRKACSETFRQQALSFSPFSSISVNACRLDWV